MTHAETVSDRPTFYAAGISNRSPGEVVCLKGDEVRHLKALRMAVGDPVLLTDGQGTLWSGRMVLPGGSVAECALEARMEPAGLLPLELAFAVGNKTHVMWLVEKATEIGVAALQPIESERTRSVADAARSQGFWSKARRRSLAAMKQSGGAWLPEILKPVTLEAYLAEASRNDEIGLRVSLDPAGPPLSGRIDGWDGLRRAAVLVGPEGGWTLEELSRIETEGFVAAGMGSRTLRFETAAVLAAGVIGQRFLARMAEDSLSTA
jgi:16S rRNA (uracil1498-N3)-methyltransferase